MQQALGKHYRFRMSLQIDGAHVTVQASSEGLEIGIAEALVNFSRELWDNEKLNNWQWHATRGWNYSDLKNPIFIN